MMSLENKISPPQVCLTNLLNVKDFEATFYNGRRLSIQYDFDRERIAEERLRVNLESLAPLFGGIVPPGEAAFVTPSKIFNFVRIIHMDNCKLGIYASCSCRQNIMKCEEDSVDRCEDGHFHHYCATHVESWLRFYLELAILLQESDDYYRQRMHQIYGRKLPCNVPLGGPGTAEYWLKYARSYRLCSKHVTPKGSIILSI
nr:repeat element protein-like protein F1.2 [Tranosema rostrale ichnovirus]